MWNIFTKLLATFFSIPHVPCKNIDNEHTLMKSIFDKLNYSDATQGTVSLSTFYHLAIIETKIVYEICTLNVRCCLIKHHVKFPSKYHTAIPWDKPLILYHKSPINLRQCVRSILQNIADAQPGSKEDQPCHLATHCCGKLEAHVSVDSLEFSCRYSSASRPVTSSKVFIIHSHQSSASEMEDTALGILF